MDMLFSCHLPSMDSKVVAYTHIPQTVLALDGFSLFPKQCLHLTGSYFACIELLMDSRIVGCRPRYLSLAADSLDIRIALNVPVAPDAPDAPGAGQ